MKNQSSLNEENRRIWDENADFWDERMGEGNDWHKTLVEPATERLLNLEPGELVLDVACGNGQFSRRMAMLGAHVVAFDFSERLIEKARARTRGDTQHIEYVVLDATDSDRLMKLGNRTFDAAVCCMALMDMAEIEPLISALSQLLKQEGRFVFSVVHPCFNSGTYEKVMEREERDGKIVDRYSIKVHAYIKPTIAKGLAMIGQPIAQYYFHRPISMILNICFKTGFILDGIEEPVFGAVSRSTSLSDNVYREIPPILVARVRLHERLRST